MRSTLRVILAVALIATVTHAYEPIPRRIPPKGKPIPEEASAKLSRELGKLQAKAAPLHSNPLLPDAEIYLKAVDLALEFGEFYKPKDDVPKAERALAEGGKRLAALKTNQAPWTKQHGLVLRGYRSQIDGSAQPYGLEIPEKLDLSGKPVPLYVWLHGRGDSQTDLHFLDQRSKKHWQFKELLNDGIVLHPFGRQCIGYKSAGEIDVIDAVNHVIANYNVDADRIALMGFSMGGAGAWHLGAHYADKWAMVHAGAGFVDVKRYQKLSPDKLPSAMEQTLWGLYDVPAYARNLLNIPVVAYSGEKDKQKDAADFMEETLKSHGHELTHIVGPGMGHKYHPDSLVEVAAFVKQSLAKPKNRNPDSIRFQTRTLRYNRYAWLEVTGLKKHWENSRIDAAFSSPNHLRIQTKNITSLRLHRALPKNSKLQIDDTTLTLEAPLPIASLVRTGADWKLGEHAARPAKSPQLQGPIDDAFLAPFLVVTPAGKSSNPKLDKWVAFELVHFKARWRALFRGDIRTISSANITPAHAAKYNLILFGTPESNDGIRQVLKTTPLDWPDKENRVLLGIYPNPAAPGRYLVLNSGPTFREGHDRTNSLQNPKLGDWAIIDLSEPPGPERAGRIIQTGFFDEAWQSSR